MEVEGDGKRKASSRPPQKLFNPREVEYVFFSDIPGDWCCQANGSIETRNNSREQLLRVRKRNVSVWIRGEGNQAYEPGMSTLLVSWLSSDRSSRASVPHWMRSRS